MANDFQYVDAVRFCALKVLPTVYDDTLSYTEQLGQYINTLNEVIENNNKLPDFITELIKGYITSGEIGDIINDAISGFILNVKYPPLGLKPAIGDGSVDDTEAIQGCINYASNKGGMLIYFPSGVYLTNSLLLRDNVSLVGFARENTRIVLKGGATMPLISGNVHGNTFSRLTLDGNMAVQVNDIDVVDLIGGRYLFTELDITDGYTLLKLDIDDYVQGNTIHFGKGVIDGLTVKGAGKVVFNNIMFKELSTLSGRYAITNSVGGAVFTDIYSACVVDTSIKNTGNNSVFVGQMFGSLNTIDDTSVDTYYNFYHRGSKEKSDLQKLVTDEATARASADDVLADAIAEEVTARQTEYSGLAKSIQDEIKARQDGDTALAQDIVDSAELLQNNLAQEILDRQTADDEIRTQIDVNNVMLNVKMFGVKGDGTTNDTLAIQKLIDDNDNVTLYFPKGDYLIDGIVITMKSISIVGDKNGKTFFLANGHNMSLIASNQEYTQYSKVYEHIGFNGNGKTNVTALKLDRLNVTYFSNIIFKNVTYGFVINCCRNSSIRNVFQIGDCCNKMYSSRHATFEYNFGLIVDNYITEINATPNPIGALFDLDSMVNTQWSNIVNMGRLECDAFYIHGMNEGVFISKCVLVCPRIGINIRMDALGAIPNCIQVSDVSVDQCFTAGAMVEGIWVMFNNCAFVNGVQRGQTESTIIVGSISENVYFNNIISYNNKYAMFNIGEAKSVFLNNCKGWATSIGTVYTCPTQTMDNPMINNCDFETVSANSFTLKNGRLNPVMYALGVFPNTTVANTPKTCFNYTFTKARLGKSNVIEFDLGVDVTADYEVTFKCNGMDVVYNEIANNRTHFRLKYVYTDQWWGQYEIISNTGTKCGNISQIVDDLTFQVVVKTTVDAIVHINVPTVTIKS